MDNDTKKCVLLLEDEEMVRFIVNDYLKEAGFEVLEFSDALPAIEEINKRNIDVAIVDINIPNMSGDDFIVKAKKMRPNIQFIIHTGSSDYKISSKLKDMGVSQDNVLIKPVEDMNIFATSVNKLIQK
jgi:DNA-binding response OmpR family regulator